MHWMLHKGLKRASLGAICFGIFALNPSFGAELKVNGYADADYQVQAASYKANTFMLFDAAIKLKKEMDGGYFFVKIPFSTPDSATTNNNFDIFKKGQAYVGYKYENGFSWKIGQWGKNFGVQPSDSADRFFARKGIIADAYNASQMGAGIGYKISDTLGFEGHIANPNNQGIMTDDNWEQGLKFVSETEDMRVGIGGRQWLRRANQEWDRLIDFFVGYKMNEIGIDFNYVWKKSAFTKMAGQGLYLQTTYAVNDSWTLGARGEYAMNLKNESVSTTVGTTTTTTYSAIHRVYEVSVGPEYNFTKSFRVRADAAYLNSLSQEAPLGKKKIGKTGTLSVVYKF